MAFNIDELNAFIKDWEKLKNSLTDSFIDSKSNQLRNKLGGQLIISKGKPINTSIFEEASIVNEIKWELILYKTGKKQLD